MQSPGLGTETILARTATKIPAGSITRSMTPWARNAATIRAVRRRPYAPPLLFRCQTADRHARALSRRGSRPSFAAACLSETRGRREGRAPADAHGPRAVKKARGRTTGSAEIPGLPCAVGFNGLLRALPGDRACLPPSSADRSAHLAPASGRQDYTAWPSTRAPVVCCRVRVHRIPPPRS
jgi:hypothetical protein